MSGAEIRALARFPFATPRLPMPMWATERGGYIYFVRCHSTIGEIKIGRCKHPSQRLSSLQNGCPYPLTFAAFYLHEDPIREEVRILDSFKDARIRGEWFLPVDDLIDLIDEIAERQLTAFQRMLKGDR